MNAAKRSRRAEDILRELLSSTSGIRLVFMLDGLPHGISPGHAGCTPTRAARLSALGIVEAVDWRPPSRGRIERRWVRLMPTVLGGALVRELVAAFRNRNIGAPARGVDALYILARERLKQDARTRRTAWEAAVTEAVDAVFGGCAEPLTPDARCPSMDASCADGAHQRPEAAMEQLGSTVAWRRAVDRAWTDRAMRAEFERETGLEPLAVAGSLAFEAQAQSGALADYHREFPVWASRKLGLELPALFAAGRAAA